MAVETERKFLLKDDTWRQYAAERHHIVQGYAHLQKDPAHSLRIRITDDCAFLTLKGPVCGISRHEFEYGIPIHDAEILLLDFCDAGRIEKYRFIVPWKDWRWEIDEFLGANSGLIVAELELQSEKEQFELPPWIGNEVTGDIRYYNYRLLERPFCEWGKCIS